MLIPSAPIFRSSAGTPLDLHNVSERLIVPKIEKCIKCRKVRSEHRTDGHMFELDETLRWHGWHAFRRGLATNLHEEKIADRDIQAILRHSHIGLTQALYIKSTSQVQIEALDLMARKLASNELCNDHATESEKSIN